MKTRIKFHCFPGSISKEDKISLLEKSGLEVKRAKAYKKMIRMKERAVIKEETKKIIASSSSG